VQTKLKRSRRSVKQKFDAYYKEELSEVWQVNFERPFEKARQALAGLKTQGGEVVRGERLDHRCA